MSDVNAHLDRIERQATPLVEDLQCIVAGRPVDAVIDALATVATQALLAEADFPREEAVEVVVEASLFTKRALPLVGSARQDRLRFTFWALYVAVLSASVINGEEG